MINSNLLLSLGACYKKINAGEYIFKEGIRCNFYNQLEEGKVKLVNIDDSGKEFLQDIIEPGECFGELPLFNNGIYADSAIAINDIVILRLARERFEQLLKDDQQINLNFFKLLANKLHYKMHILKEISSHEPEHCIISLLQYLATTKKCFCPSCSLVKLTRQQIADMTGLRVETVIRTMRAMHEKGYIAIEKGKVYFNNMRPIINACCVSP